MHVRRKGLQGRDKEHRVRVTVGEWIRGHVCLSGAEDVGDGWLACNGRHDLHSVEKDKGGQLVERMDVQCGLREAVRMLFPCLLYCLLERSGG